MCFYMIYNVFNNSLYVNKSIIRIFIPLTMYNLLFFTSYIYIFKYLQIVSM